MPIHGPTFVVDQHATLDGLKAFTDAAHKDARILGKVDKATGNTILYVSDKSPSLFSMLSGKASTRRDLAKAAFTELVDKSFDKISSDGRQLNASDRAALKAITDTVHNRVHDTGGHSLRGGLISLLASGVQGADALGRAPQPKPGPKLASLGDFNATIGTTATGLQTLIKNGGDVETAGKAFGDLIAQQFRAGNPSGDDLFLFATSPGHDLKDALLQAMGQVLGGDAGIDLAKSPKAKEFIDAAYNQAASRMQPGGEVPDTGTLMLWTDGAGASFSMEMPDIMLGNTRYEPIEHLGSGGYAEVFKYRAMDGTGKEIAYKVAKNEDPGAEIPDGMPEKPDVLGEMGAEARIHRAMEGGAKHDNIVALEGIVRTPDGRLGIAMELAPGGTVLSFAKQLKSVTGEGPGKVPPEMAELVRLRLLLDMAEGTRHIQDTQGGVHGDLKSPNVLIGADGRAKIADFGLAREGSSAELQDVNTPDNPTWLSPQVLAGKKELSDLEKLEPPMMNYVLGSIGEMLRRYLPDATDRQVKTLAGAIMRPVIEEERAKVTVDYRSDTWALGVMALDLWSGEMLLSKEKFTADVGQRIREFIEDPSNTAIGQIGPDGKPEPGALSGSTGNPEVDGAVNRLLAPNGDDRPDMGDFVNDGMFDKPGMDSQELRDLISAIATGDAGKIAEKTAALKAVMDQGAIDDVA